MYALRFIYGHFSGGIALDEESVCAYPVKRSVGLRPDQDALLIKAKKLTGRAIVDILRDGGITLARRIISDSKRQKPDE